MSDVCRNAFVVELQRMQSVIRAAFGEKLGVGSALHDSSAIENKYEIRVDDRRETMRDDEHRATRKESVHCFLHEALRLGVER